jgi:hypothetical protein
MATMNKPSFKDICERFAKNTERRIKDKGLTEAEYIQKREEYESQFKKKEVKKEVEETEEIEGKWWDE